MAIRAKKSTAAYCIRFCGYQVTVNANNPAHAVKKGLSLIRRSTSEQLPHAKWDKVEGTWKGVSIEKV